MKSNAKKALITILGVLAEKIESLEMLLDVAGERETQAAKVMKEQARELKTIIEDPARAALIDVARAAREMIQYAKPMKGKHEGDYRCHIGPLKNQIERWLSCGGPTVT